MISQLVDGRGQHFPQLRIGLPWVVAKIIVAAYVFKLVFAAIDTRSSTSVWRFLADISEPTPSKRRLKSLYKN